MVRRPPAHPACDSQPVPRRGHDQRSKDPRRRLWNWNDAHAPDAIRRRAGRGHGRGGGRVLPRSGTGARDSVGRRQPSFSQRIIRPGHRARCSRAHRRRSRRLARDETGPQARGAAAADRARLQVPLGPPGRHQSSQAPVRGPRAARPVAGGRLRGGEADLHELDSVSGHRCDQAGASRPTGAAEARV